MGNCLVTKLKESVQNDNIFKLTDVVLSLNDNESYALADRKITLAGNGNLVRVTGDSYFCTSEGEWIGNSITLTTASTDYYVRTYNNTKMIIEDASSLTLLGLLYMNCEVDKMNLYKARNLTRINSYRGNFSPDISSFAGMTSLSTMNLAGVSGNIASLVDVNLPTILGNSPNLTGDLALAADNILTIVSAGNFTYSERAHTKNVVVINGGNLGSYVDIYLNDSNQCQVPAVYPGDWAKVIKIKGTRTSASDSAVASLKGKGYTIIVNDETL